MLDTSDVHQESGPICIFEDSMLIQIQIDCNCNVDFLPSNFSILGGLTCITWADLKVLGSQPTLTLTLSPSTESIMASSKPPSPSGTQTLFLASKKREMNDN